METLNALAPVLLTTALIATFIIMISGILSFAMNRDFNRKYSNLLMRARVVAQAVAVLAFGIVLFLKSTS